MTSPRDAVATDSGRFYERHGRKYISVTNVIDKAVAKPALMPWAVKLTAEAALATFNQGGEAPFHPGQFTTTQRPRRKPGAQSPPGPWDWKAEHARVRDESADKGTLIHAWAEAWVLGQSPDPPLGLESECLGIMRAFEKYGIEVAVAECTVYNNVHDYAGTSDLFATVGAWDGVLAVLDYKTGKSVWPEVSLQLSAYRYGEFIGLPDDSDVEVPWTERAGVLHVGHTETTLVPVRTEIQDFTAFLSALGAARWVVEQSGLVIGEVV